MIIKGIKTEHSFDFEKGFLKKINSLPEGDYSIEFKLRDKALESYKRHYFSQVDKLAVFLGYMSKADRDIFKSQLSTHFGYSITDINTIDEMKIRMEELYQFASIEYNYLFEPYNPE